MSLSIYSTIGYGIIVPLREIAEVSAKTIQTVERDAAGNKTVIDTHVEEDIFIPGLDDEDILDDTYKIVCPWDLSPEDLDMEVAILDKETVVELEYAESFIRVPVWKDINKMNKRFMERFGKKPAIINMVSMG